MVITCGYQDIYCRLCNPKGGAQLGMNHIELAVVLRLNNVEPIYAEMRRREHPWRVDDLQAESGMTGPHRKKLVDWLTSKSLVVTRQSPFVIWLEGPFEDAATMLGIGFEFRV